MSARPQETFDRSTVLLADDEAPIRNLLRSILLKDEFHVLQAEDGSQALQVAEGHQVSIQLLVTDIVMPGLNGYEMAQRVRESRPDIKVLYITGLVDSDVGRRCVADQNGTVLSKPFTPKELLSFFSSTLALGITAPEESATVPVSEPVTFCALRLKPEKQQSIVNIRNGSRAIRQAFRKNRNMDPPLKIRNCVAV